MNLLMTKLKALRPWDRYHPHQLGAAYAKGDGAPKDSRIARRWYERGARRGDAESQYDLGFMLLLGEGGPTDTTRGLAWLTQAARDGSGDAARLLADLYRDGALGVPKDAAQSEQYVKRFNELRAQMSDRA
jgi:TPR repeat protein